MSGINISDIRPGDRVSFHGMGGSVTSRRVCAVMPGKVGIWHRGTTRFLAADEITSWEITGRARDTDDCDD